MLSDPALLLVFPVIGLALAASVTLVRERLPRWTDLALVTLSAIVPLALAERTDLVHDGGHSLWEWSAVAGAAVQAAYHVDPLAVIGASAVALAGGVTIHGIDGARPDRIVLATLVAAQCIVLVALVSVTDLVAGALVAGTAAVLCVATGLFVATPAAAGRLAALLAVGVEAFITAALLLARFGVPTFDLERVPSGAISSGVTVAIALAAALFCGLYPFVPWRYESEAAAPSALADLRGAALFPAGVAGSVLAMRVIAAVDAPTTSIELPAIGVPWYVAMLVLVAVLGALAAREAPPANRRRRALTASVFFLFAAALPMLRWSHVIALLALLTVMYATVASAALAREWRVARFDVWLATLWAAIASGSALAVAGALFGILASSVALVIDELALTGRAQIAASAGARLLTVIGPVTALLGVISTPDPVVGAIAGFTVAWAIALELAHAVVRGAAGATLRERIYAVLAAIAALALFADVAMVPATSAAFTLLGRGPVSFIELRYVVAAALVVVLAIVVVALPDVVRWRAGPRVLSALRRVLGATDPAPTLALTYRGLQFWSARTGAVFATLEDRAGVWFAIALIALALVWAATS